MISALNILSQIAHTTLVTNAFRGMWDDLDLDPSVCTVQKIAVGPKLVLVAGPLTVNHAA